ncbi:hypothetical protein LQF76_07445 [Gloeomargaritales cyanobacterium VI4D9]|nr:hypothetical protein LQF76_07445 [Gloeomargaritales cyanobacterium VI4D9]
MLIMAADQVQLTAMDYAQILGKWFVRGQAFALAQEATAKKACQKILDAEGQEPFCVLVKSATEITLWHETQAVPSFPTSDEAQGSMSAATQEIRKFRGQVVNASPVACESATTQETRKFRGQVVHTPTSPVTPASSAPKTYRGRSY